MMLQGINSGLFTLHKMASGGSTKSKSKKKKKGGDEVTAVHRGSVVAHRYSQPPSQSMKQPRLKKSMISKKRY
jgi:hypothetical protein